MTKRLVEIDDALLERARVSLGTQGIRDTVVAALERAVSEESIEEREAVQQHARAASAVH